MQNSHDFFNTNTHSGLFSHMLTFFDDDRDLNNLREVNKRFKNQIDKDQSKLYSPCGLKEKTNFINILNIKKYALKLKRFEKNILYFL